MASKGPKAAGDNKKAASSKPAPAPKAAATSTKATEADASESAAQAGGSSKPDQAAYNKEQDTLKTQIDAAQVKLVGFCFNFRLHTFLRGSFIPAFVSTFLIGISVLCLDCCSC